MGRRPIELSDTQRQEVETLAALLNQEQIECRDHCRWGVDRRNQDRAGSRPPAPRSNHPTNERFRGHS